MRSYLRTFLTREAASQFVKVGIVGVGNTVVSFALFNLFFTLAGWSWFWAVAAAFAITTFLSYLVNRRWSFRLTDGRVSGQETLRFYLVNIAAWAATEAIGFGADRLFGPLDAVSGNLTYLAASVIILVPKFASYRDLVFGGALRATDVSQSR